MLNQRTIFAYTHSFGRWARQAVVCAAVVALTACGGGDGSGSGIMTINPDPPETIDGAVTRDPTDIGTSDQTLRVRDVDVFRLVPPQPGRLEINVMDGTARTQFEVIGRDRNGNPVELDTMPGSIIVFITGDHIRIGLQVFVRVSAAPGAGSVATGSYTLETRLIPDTTATSTPPTI